MTSFVIETDDQGASAVLTTGPDGLPVLRLAGREPSGDFLPADAIGSFGSPGQGVVRAADLVMAWGSRLERTPPEVDMASQYLRRWSDGPQLRGLDAKCQKGGA